jgi:hypothetical protein
MSALRYLASQAVSEAWEAEMSFFALLDRLFGPAVPPDAIRSEIYFLGSRHRGEVLKGAIEELKSPGLEPDRSRLLRAVIDQLTRANRSDRAVIVR